MAQLECDLCGFKGEEDGDWSHKDIGVCGMIHTCPKCNDKWTCDNCQVSYSIYAIVEGMQACFYGVFPISHRCGQICFKCEDEIEKAEKAERTILIFVLPGGEEWTEGRPLAIKITEAELQELKDGAVPKHLEDFGLRINGTVDVEGGDDLSSD